MKITKQQSSLFLPVFIDEINQSLISLTYKQANIGLITGLICAFIIWYRLHSYMTSPNLNIWMGVIVGITLLRLALVKIYHNAKNQDKDNKIWRYLFILNALLGGLCWGAIAFLLLPYVNENDHILILMILAGITAGAVAFIAGILAAAYTFLIAALLPVSFHYLINHTDYLIGMTIGVYLLFLLHQAKRVHNMLLNGLLLQFELKEAKDQLELTATHDPLTNVANRLLFNSYFTQAIKDAKDSNTNVALLYLDLNKFKEINDKYGHHTGDQILLAFVLRLRTLFKERDMIARLGGDEFTITIRNFPKKENIATIVSQVAKLLENPIVINNQKFNISASLGISIYPTDGFDIESLLKVADRNMYDVKRALS